MTTTTPPEVTHTAQFRSLRAQKQALLAEHNRQRNCPSMGYDEDDALARMDTLDLQMNDELDALDRLTRPEQAPEGVVDVRVGGERFPFPAALNERAMRNHGGQTLARLEERGGLDWAEAVWIIENRRWKDCNISQADAEKRVREYFATPTEPDFFAKTAQNSEPEAKEDCPICGRLVFSENPPATGFIAKCGRRLALLEQCSINGCPEPIAEPEAPVGDARSRVKSIINEHVIDCFKAAGVAAFVPRHPGPAADAILTALKSAPARGDLGEAILDALHERLPYPTEACAIVRSVLALNPAPAEQAERPTTGLRVLGVEGFDADLAKMAQAEQGGVVEAVVVSPVDAFEMGFVWAQSLTGQTLEDSRAVGRTLRSRTFDQIADAIERETKAQGFNSFEDADSGICAAKRIIFAALNPAPAEQAEALSELQQLGQAFEQAEQGGVVEANLLSEALPFLEEHYDWVTASDENPYDNGGMQRLKRLTDEVRSLADSRLAGIGSASPTPRGEVE